MTSEAYRRAQEAAKLLGQYSGGRAPRHVLEQVHVMLAAQPPQARAEAFSSLARTLNASNAVEPASVHIELKGKVGHEFAAGGRSFSFMDVAKQLRAADATAHVCVTIDSSGGGAEEGVEIYHLLKSHKGLVTTIARDQCMSAAGAIFMAGGYRKAHAGTAFMVHPVAFNSGYARDGYVSAAELAADAKELQRQTDLILGIYAERATAPLDRFRQLCKAGKDFDADTAKRLGIVHAVIPAPPSRNHPRFHA